MAQKISFPEAFRQAVGKSYLVLIDQTTDIPNNNIEIRTSGFSRTELEHILPICIKHKKLLSISSDGFNIRLWTYDEPGLSSMRRKTT